MSHLIISSLENSLSRLIVSSQFLLKNRPTPHGFVRYYQRPRKPFWLPIAKTKMFRIPQKPVAPEDESLELSRLIRIYRTHMKSLRLHFKEQLMAQTTAPEVIEERKQREAEQHANCIRENELWNAEVAKVREERLAKEAQEREERILKRIMDHDKEQKRFLEEIEENVRKVKEKLFITPDNIDEAIEVALSTVVDHNFGIDVNENIYKGRYSRPQISDSKRLTPPPTLLEANKPESLEAQN